MEIIEFEKDFEKLKQDPDIKLSVLGADDVEDKEKVKIIVNGKEIKSKVSYLICIELKEKTE